MKVKDESLLSDHFDSTIKILLIWMLKVTCRPLFYNMPLPFYVIYCFAISIHWRMPTRCRKQVLLRFTQNFQQAILQQNQLIDNIHTLYLIQLQNIFFKRNNTKTLLTFCQSFLQFILIKMQKYVERVKTNKKVCTK